MVGLMVDEGMVGGAAIVAGETMVDEVDAEGGVEEGAVGGVGEGVDVEAFLKDPLAGGAVGFGEGGGPFGFGDEVAHDDGVAHASEGVFEDPAMALVEELVAAGGVAVVAEGVVGEGLGGVVAEEVAVLGGEVGGVAPEGVEAFGLAAEAAEGGHEGEAGEGAHPGVSVGEVLVPFGGVEAEGGMDGVSEDAGGSPGAGEVGGGGEGGLVALGFEPLAYDEHVLEIFGVAGGVEEGDVGVGPEGLEEGGAEVAVEGGGVEAGAEEVGDADGFVETAGDVFVEFGDHPASVGGEEEVVAGELEGGGLFAGEEGDDVGGDAEALEEVGALEEGGFEAGEDVAEAFGDVDGVAVFLGGEDDGGGEDEAASAGLDVPFEVVEAEGAEEVFLFGGG